MRWTQLMIMVVLAAPNRLPAQVLNARITGTITDSSGALVPHAALTVTNEDLQAILWRGTSNAEGIYLAPALLAGTYEVAVSSAGFKKEVIRGIRLEVNQSARVDVVLQLGPVTETISVSGASLGRLEPENSSLGTAVDSSQIANLPLNGHAATDLVGLIPGAATNTTTTSFSIAAMSINGSRTLNNEISVDGVSTLRGAIGAPSNIPNAEEMEEINVQTSAYSAEFGRTSGGYINMMLKTGTNQLHGEAWEYFQNEDLNANDFFSNLRGTPRPRSRSNEMGVLVGGPVWIPKVYHGKEKTFFLFDYVRFPFSWSTTTNLSTIPAPSFRTGDFSSSPVAVFDPLSNAPFPGNQIPASRLDTAAQKIMALLPQPNSPGTPNAATGVTTNNYVLTTSVRPISYSYMGRIDHSFSDRDRFFARVERQISENHTAPVIPGPLDTGSVHTISTGVLGTSNYTHIFTPTLILEARFGFNRFGPLFYPPNQDVNVQSVLGIQTSIGKAVPSIAITGFSSYGYPSNELNLSMSNTYTYNVSTTWSRGRNTAKFGFDYRKDQFNQYAGGSSYAGVYDFNGSITSGSKTSGNPVNALGDFLLGNIYTANYSVPQPEIGERNWNMGLYLQDDIKLTRRLTVNAGLRWEYESPMIEAHNIFTRVNVVTYTLLVAGQNASRDLNLDASKLNFSPRLGFAYSLNDKTVIRSAFGIFYSQTFSNIQSSSFAGYTQTQTYGALAPGVPQAFSLTQGMPITFTAATFNPLAVAAAATDANPLNAQTPFASITPLPMTMQWNFGIQRNIGSGIVIDASYAGSRSDHLPIYLPYNTVPWSAVLPVAQNGTSIYKQDARPAPTVGGFGAITNAGTSDYNSLQIKASRQFSKRLGFLAAYTFAKSIDDQTGLFGSYVPNGLNRGQLPNLFRFLDKAVSDFNRPNRFTIGAHYTTPGPRLLRGFTISPIFLVENGLPFTITQTNENPIANAERPNVINSNSLYAGLTPAGTSLQYLLPTTSPNFPLIPAGPVYTGSGASRTLIVPTLLGDLGRNVVVGPGVVNLNLGVGRKFTLKERFGAEIRLEMFDALNHPNFAEPSFSLSVATNSAGTAATFNSPNFGLISSTTGSRAGQLILKLTF